MKKVLIIDDDIEELDLFETVLGGSTNAFDFTCVVSAAELHSAIRHFYPDFVIVTGSFAFSQNLLFIKQLRNLLPEPRAKIILYQISYDTNYSDLAYKAGVDLCLEKPASFDGVVEFLNRLILNAEDKE